MNNILSTKVFIKKIITEKLLFIQEFPTSNQKYYLKNQVDFLRQYANAKGIIVYKVIEDYGSGLNYNRKKGINLLIAV